MDRIDRARDTRKGEELDTSKVEAFLRDTLPDLTGALTIRQFPGGHSNLTYLVRVGDKEMILRRPPIGRKAKTAHDMKREFNVLSALHPVFPCCPKPLVYSEDETVIGCPFYLMERIRGMVIRREFSKGFMLSTDQARKLLADMVNVHAALHSIDYRTVGLADFGKPEGYVRRQVEGWSERYRQAHTPDAPDYERIMGWIHDHIPEERPRATIIHNDFKLDNMIVDAENPTKVIGVLDWEMATLGDPLMDIMNAIAYKVDAGDAPEVHLMRFMPAEVEFSMTRKELLELYRKNYAFEFDSIDFYYCFGLFRLAVIAQQIYYRFYHKQTTDERFKMMIFAVQILEKAALKTIEAGFN